MNTFRIEPEELVTSANGVNIELQSYAAPGTAIDMHIHSSIEVLYIQSGTFEVFANDTRYQLCAGDLFLLRKHSAHAVNVLSAGSYYVIKIHPSILSEFAAWENASAFELFFSLNSGEQKCLWHKNDLEASRLITPLSDIICDLDTQDLLSFTSLKLNVGRLLVALMRSSYEKRPSNFEFMKLGSSVIGTIHRAIEYINLHYSENLTTRDAAYALNLSYAYFSGCFSKVTGVSFKEYLNQTRINHAKSLIINSGLSVSQVGQKVGFNSASHFILEFRRRTGMTPLEFHKKYQNNF